MAPTPRVVVHRDADAAAKSAAEEIAALLRAAATQRGVANVAFSGGGSAGVMLRELAQQEVPWNRVHVYQVDERVAPDGDPDRNATSLCRDLLDVVAIPRANVHLLPVTATDLDEAAATFGAHLPRFDVMHMGLGEDGHTASWPPGDPVIEVRHQPLAVVGPFNGHLRMTITPGVTACRLTIHLTATAAGCAAAIIYAHTSLGPAGDEFVAAFTEAFFAKFMQDWEARVNHYLKHGEALVI